MDNLTMVEVIREGKTRGKWVCPVCGDRKAKITCG